MGVSRRFDDHGELVFAQFIRGLNENHERFDACASPVDHAANLTSRMGQRLRRWQRQHDFPRRWRFEVAVSVGGAGGDHNVAGDQARRRICAELPLNGTAAGQLDDQAAIVSHGLTLAASGAPLQGRVSGHRRRNVASCVLGMRCPPDGRHPRGLNGSTRGAPFI